MKWSYAKLSTYAQCPLKFKLKYLDKIPMQQRMNENREYGSKVHKILENHFNGANPKHNEKIVEILLQSKWYSEIENVIDVEYKISTDNFVGYVDLIYEKGSKTHLADFKVVADNVKWLKYKDFQKEAQLALYRHYYNKDAIAEFILLDKNHFEIDDVRCHLPPSQAVTWMEEIKESIKDGNFKGCESNLCAWCDYESICM